VILLKIKNGVDWYYGELSKQNALTVSVCGITVGGRDAIVVCHPSPGGKMIRPF
jgi:hypothetical protein